MADSFAVKPPSSLVEAEAPPGRGRRFLPAQRDPLRLPTDKIELPSPPQSPGAPPQINLLTTILPPAIMIGGVLIVTLISGQANWTLIAPTLVMSLGFPVANMISLFSQKKKHKTALEKREKVYLGQLAEQRNRLDALVQKQRTLLEDSYPALPAVLKIALSGSKSMWSRRPVDEDFLDLRIGTSADAPTIKIEPPRFSDPNDNLPALALELVNSYQVIPDLPALLHLARLGSVAISGRTPAVYGLTRRLVLDLITHHSPEDVQVAVLGDTREAVEQWEWLKWIPHTDALGADRKSQRLAFEPLQIDKSLEMLMADYQIGAALPMTDRAPAREKAASRRSLSWWTISAGSANTVMSICWQNGGMRPGSTRSSWAGVTGRGSAGRGSTCSTRLPSG